MANTITWSISAMDVKPTVGSLPDYVVTAHYRVDGTDGNGHTGSTYSTVSFPESSDHPDFVPFDQLTEAQVIEWVKAALGAETVAAAEKSVNDQITDAINPPILHPANPWAANTAAPAA